jgi:glycosyltransferase involved in cell wall biosynthesis
MTDKTMRVALVMSHADRNMVGAIREMTFCRALQEKAAIETRVFRMFRGGGVEEETYLHGSVRTTFCPADDSSLIPHRQISSVMVREIAEFKPDFIIFKGLSYEINRYIHDRFPGTPFGFIVGGSVTDRILRQAGFVFGEYAEQLNTYFSSFVRMNRAFVMPKYINFDCCKIDRKTEVKEFDIVNVGNFHEKRKNQVDLLKFADRYKIALVGAAGKMYDELVELCPNPDNLIFMGRLDHAAVFDVLKRSKIMVHTATMEGLPRAMIEGMACGLPVVAYRSTVLGGISQGEHGFLVEQAALEPAVDLLLRDDHIRVAIGNRAKRYVERHHGVLAINAAAVSFGTFLRSL